MVELAESPLEPIQVPAQRPGQLVPGQAVGMLAQTGPHHRGLVGLIGLVRARGAEDLPHWEIEQVRQPDDHARGEPLQRVGVNQLVDAHVRQVGQVPEPPEVKSCAR